MSEVDVPDRFISSLKTGVTYDDIRDEYDFSPSQARRRFQLLREQGVTIDHKEVNENGKRLFYIPDEVDKTYKFGDGDGEYRFGLISDTHLGSSAEHLEELHDYYDRIQEEGIDVVFHAGDISDGHEVHTGHLNVLKPEAIGWGRLKDYVVENYPEREGVHTFFISGNHDHKLHRRQGVRFGEMVEEARDDLHWLGDSMAQILLDPDNDIDMELIHPGGGKPYCYSGDTRVLTESHGFVRFDDIQKLILEEGNIRVATFNPGSGELEFQTPDKFVRMPWKGDMIHFQGQSLDMMVTPNHRMIVRKNKRHHGYESDWIIREAEYVADSFTRQKWDIPRSAEWTGSNLIESVTVEAEHPNGNNFEAELEDYLDFLGWFVAEGWTREPGRIQMSQSPAQQAPVVEAVESVGLNVRAEQDKVLATNMALSQKLDREVGCGAKNKRVPGWVKNLPTQYIEIFLQSLFEGDGHKENGKLKGYTTASERLAHDVIECLIKTGRSASLNERRRKWEMNGEQGVSHVYELSVSNSKKGKAPSLCKEPERVSWDDYVYCFAVPNETLLVMRNGKPFFSGNTAGYRVQTLYRERPADQRPTIAAIGHLHGSLFTKTEGVHGFYTGAWKGLTTYGKRKGHHAAIGGWIVDLEVEDGELRRITPDWIGYSANDDTPNMSFEDINAILDDDP